MKQTLRLSTLAIALMLCTNLFAYETISWANSNNQITSNTTWTSGTTYYIKDVVEVFDATLTIQAGAIIKIGDGYFDVGYSTPWPIQENHPGTININGTSNSHVIITSMHDNSVGETIAGSTGNPAAGDWNSFGFFKESDFNITYTDFYYSAGYVSGTTVAGNAVIVLQQGDPSSIEHCTFNHCNHYAIYINNNTADISFNTDNITADNISIIDCEQGLQLYRTDPTNFTNITIETNTSLIAHLSNILLPDLSIWNILTPNPTVRVSGHLFDNSVFANNDIVYLISGSLLANNLDIAAGCILKFDWDAGIEITDGILNVNGTSDNPVIFTSTRDDVWGGDTNGDGNSTTPYPGSWGGIFIDGADSDIPGNASINMENAFVYYGGAQSYESASIKLNGCDQLSIFEDVRVEMSDKKGLWAIDSQPRIKSCAFLNNGENAIHTNADAEIIPPLFFRNNATYDDGIDIYNSSADSYVATHCDWGTIDSTEIAERVWEQHDDPAVGEVTSWPIFQNDKPDYHMIDPNYIAEQNLQHFALEDNLNEGSIFVYQTSDGNYGKFIIQVKSDSYYYFWWETFSGDSTKSVGHNLIVPFDSYVDMDLGIVSDQSTADFRIHVNGYIYPENETLSTLAYSYCDYESHNGTIYESEYWEEGTHVVDGAFSVYYGATLSIAPGSVVKFTEGSFISVIGNFTAWGSEDKPIIFTSANDNFTGCMVYGTTGNPQPGDWKYIETHGFQDPETTIRHCTFRYGGGSSAIAMLSLSKGHGTCRNSVIEYSASSGLHLNDHEDVDIEYCEFRNNAGNGLEYGYYADVDFDFCSFTDNGNYPVYITNGVLLSYLTDNECSGNLMEGVVINSLAPGYDHIFRNGNTLYGNDFPFVFLNDITFNNNEYIYVYPGTHMKFGPGVSINMNYGSKLDINGGVLTSINDDEYSGDTNNDGDATLPEAGDWDGIYIRSANNGGQFGSSKIRYAGVGNYGAINYSNGGGGEVNNCTIEHSLGYGIATSGINLLIEDNTIRYCEKSGVYLSGVDTLIVQNNVITNNLEHGIYVYGASPEIYNNTIEQNSQYPIYIAGSSVLSGNINGNSSSQNLMEGIAVQSLNINFTTTFKDSGMPYIMLNSINGYSSADTLIFEPNVIVKFMEDKGIISYNAIIANGAVFTSIKDDDYGGDSNNDGIATSPAPGDWRGIEVRSTRGEFNETSFRYGGASNSPALYFNNSNGYVDATIDSSAYDGLYLNNADNVVVENSDFMGNARYGIHIYSINSCVISNSTIHGNGSHGMYLNFANANLRDNTITDNTGKGIYNNAAYAATVLNLGNNDVNDKGGNILTGNDGGNYQFYNNTPFEVNAYYNDWGYNTAAEIDAHIYDDDEDASKGQVFFNPWGTSNPLSFTITLDAGWGGLSSYIEPADGNIADLFSPIEDDMVILQSETEVYWPGQNVNTMVNWDSHLGYKIKMTQESELTYLGDEVENKSVDLNTGWNIIPVLSNGSVELTDIFDGIELAMVKEVAGWKVYWPEFGINTLESLQSGLAYFVNCNAPGTIEFSTGKDTETTLTGFKTLSGLSPWNEITQTPNTQTIAFPETFNVLQEGDMIGAFTYDGRCAGLAPVVNGTAAVVLNGNDGLSSQKDGFAEGEQISFKLYRPATDEEFNLEVSYANRFDNSGLFHTNGMSVVSGISTNQSGLEDLTGLGANINIYPNPSHGMISIDGLSDNATVSVFDAYGNEIQQTVLLDAGEINLSGQVKGVYFIRIENEKGSVFEKVILN